jgi:hypothetical protein
MGSEYKFKSLTNFHISSIGKVLASYLPTSITAVIITLTPYLRPKMSYSLLSQSNLEWGLSDRCFFNAKVSDNLQFSKPPY